MELVLFYLPITKERDFWSWGADTVEGLLQILLHWLREKSLEPSILLKENTDWQDWC